MCKGDKYHKCKGRSKGVWMVKISGPWGVRAGNK